MDAAPSSEHVPFARTHERRSRTRLLFEFQSAHDNDRLSFRGLSHEERSTGRDLVGNSDFRDLQWPPEHVRRADFIEQSRQARDSERDADNTVAPGTAETVVDDDADIRAELFVK